MMGGGRSLRDGERDIDIYIYTERMSDCELENGDGEKSTRPFSQKKKIKKIANDC